MYQTGDTIKSTLDEIQRHDLVLPAIQREFVWRPEQICRLFDSLMQGYPFGTFLYWRVDPENSDKFKIYDFVREYHEKNSPHCPPLAPMPNQRLTAVLDGQQRLTALNVGLRGSMAWKLPRKRWNNPSSFPVRRLHLDLLWQPDEDEEGLKYRFSFLTDDENSGLTQDGECWFPVKDVLAMIRGPAMVRWLNQHLPQEQVDQAYETLDTLHRVVHTEKIVAYYEEKNQELEKILQIFIRTNSGGTPLSYSDLLLSVAVAQWTHHDAREEIHSLVDELNRIGVGFTFSKDLVLKAGLMLSDIGSVGFKVENFNRENMAAFEDKWDEIKSTLMLTVHLISDFGLNAQNLSAHNAILPIAYYIYMRNLREFFLTHSRFQQDREAIREWLIRSLMKSGVWGSGLDTLLTALRQVIRDNGGDGFPADRIYSEMARRGRSLVFEEEEIEDIVDMQSGNRLAFALLSLIFPFVDLRNQFHIDHVFPASRFTEKRLLAAGVAEERIDDVMSCKNRLANLQLLEGAVNLEKSARAPMEWLDCTYSDPNGRQDYLERHLLGDLPESIVEFESFYDARRARLKKKIEQLVSK